MQCPKVPNRVNNECQIIGSVTHSVMRGVAVLRCVGLLPPRSLPGVLTRFPVGQLRDADWPCVVLWVCGW